MSAFARGLLQDSRNEAKRSGVKVPPGLHAHMDCNGVNPWAEVRDRNGNIVWKGSASDAWEARSNAIDALIEDSGRATP